MDTLNTVPDPASYTTVPVGHIAVRDNERGRGQPFIGRCLACGQPGLSIEQVQLAVFQALPVGQQMMSNDQAPEPCPAALAVKQQVLQTILVL